MQSLCGQPNCPNNLYIWSIVFAGVQLFLSQAPSLASLCELAVLQKCLCLYLLNRIMRVIRTSIQHLHVTLTPPSNHTQGGFR